MTIEEIQLICRKLKGTTEDIKWEDHLCFSIGDKIYLITSPDALPISASFKTSAEDFDILCEQTGFRPAPYLARYKWVKLDNINLLSITDWEKYIQNSYDLVYSKLPARMKKEIELN